MKNIIITILISQIPYFIYGQYSRIDTTNYVNGQIEEIIYTLKNDSSRIIHRFYSQYDKFENGTFYMGDVKPNKLESITNHVIRGNLQLQKGEAEYFFEDGDKKLEAIYFDHEPDKYINQWTDDKKQILKNGIGIYYQKYMKRSTEFGSDSTAYEIVDSLKNGVYEIWCPSSKNSYYICGIGQYHKGKEQPLRIDYFESGKIERIYYIQDDLKTGEYHEFHYTGNYKEYGFYENGMRNGEWKTWSTNGNLQKIQNYDLGNPNGKYQEYHPNGILKISGQYEYGTGQDTIVTIDILTLDETLEITESDKIPFMHGRWINFDIKGKEIGNKIYNLGILITKYE